MITNYSDITGEKIRRIAGMILLFALVGFPLAGQGEAPGSDTTYRERLTAPARTQDGDTLNLSEKRKSAEKVNMDEVEHSANKAMFYSLFLPGLGQAYNKKYFKIPIIYGALGGVSYWIYYNTQGYRQASENYSIDQSSFNERILRAWRRNLELSYITLVAAHALQVLDAYVDAHLFFWDVNPDLTVRLEPSIQPAFTTTGVPVNNYGFSCKLTF